MCNQRSQSGRIPAQRAKFRAIAQTRNIAPKCYFIAEPAFTAIAIANIVVFAICFTMHSPKLAQKKCAVRSSCWSLTGKKRIVFLSIRFAELSSTILWPSKWPSQPPQTSQSRQIQSRGTGHYKVDDATEARKRAIETNNVDRLLQISVENLTQLVQED